MRTLAVLLSLLAVGLASTLPGSIDPEDLPRYHGSIYAIAPGPLPDHLPKEVAELTELRVFHTAPVYELPAWADECKRITAKPLPDSLRDKIMPGTVVGPGWIYFPTVGFTTAPTAWGFIRALLDDAWRK